MRLAGLHSLTVGEIPAFEAVHRGETLSERLLPGANKKYEGSPLAKVAANKDETEASMAGKLGVHPTTYSRWKHPKDKSKGRQPSLDNLRKIKREVGAQALKQFGLD